MVSRVKTLTKNLSDQFPVLYQNRYCDQKEFSIGVFSNDYRNGDVSTFKPYLLNTFDIKTYLPRLSKPKYSCKAVSSGSDIYVFGQNDDHNSLSFEKYSSSTKSWKTLPLLNTLQNEFYYMCSFMQKVFFISYQDSDDASMFYDDQTNQWTYITSLIENTKNAASTVFEGKLILSGGIRKNFFTKGRRAYSRRYRRNTIVKSIEAYDFHENKWNSFPDMLSPRNNHSAVSIGNKMFMIGGSSDYSEVFESVTRKFTYIKTLPKWVRTLKKDIFERYEILYQVINIGYTIYFFREEYNKVNVHSYDVRNNIFSFKTSMVKEIFNFNKTNCIKVPIS